MVQAVATTEPQTALSKAEKRRLRDLEKTIEIGLASFVSVGHALMLVRQERLHREQYRTFEAYVKDRWHFQRRHAYRLIAAAEVVTNIAELPAGDGTAPNLEQTRELSKLKPVAQRKAWAQALKSTPEGHVTGAAVKKVVAAFMKERDNTIHHSSESAEHYTPDWYLEAVVQLFGGPIELDPCADPNEKPHVEARRRFTINDDGLKQDWSAANLFMNPPYGDGIGAWTEKLRRAYEDKEVREAIALLPGRVDTQWFQAFAAYPWLAHEGRIRFIGNDDPAPFPSVSIYLGPWPGRFVEVFGEFGIVYTRLR